MPDSQNTTSTDDALLRGSSGGFPPEGVVGRDDFTVAYETARLNRGHQTVLSGNYADLQRLGAQIATGSVNATEAIGAPADTDPKDKSVLTPAQHDAAKGEVTTESIRAGLNDFPPPGPPSENKEPGSYDPTSVSPQQRGQSSSPPQSATKK